MVQETEYHRQFSLLGQVKESSYDLSMEVLFCLQKNVLTESCQLLDPQLWFFLFSSHDGFMLCHTG